MFVRFVKALVGWVAGSVVRVMGVGLSRMIRGGHPVSAYTLIIEALFLAWSDGAKGRPLSPETGAKLQEGLNGVYALGLRRGLIMARDAALVDLMVAEEDENYETHLISSLEAAIEAVPE